MISTEMFLTQNLMIAPLDNPVADSNQFLQPGETIQANYIDDNCNIYDKLKKHINRIRKDIESPQD
jgi:hypothetical protein